MVIISKSAINKFGNDYPDCEDALSNWYKITKIANWNNYHELKKPLIQLMRSVIIDMYLI